LKNTKLSFKKSSLVYVTFFTFLFAFANAQTIPFRTYQLKIQGMVCGFCAQGLTKTLKKNKDVLDVTLDLDLQQAIVKVKKDSKTEIKELTEAVEDAGFKVQPSN
jgi:copper chaperone CopZ